MYIATCIDKFRDKNDNIFGYRLLIGNTKQVDIEAKKLKIAIDKKEILVTNLKLTSDKRLVDCVDTSIKNAESSTSKLKRPYDAESYLEFFNLLVPFMEKSLKFSRDAANLGLKQVSIDPNTEILESYRELLGDAVKYNRTECCTELEFMFTVNNKRGYFVIALNDFKNNKRIHTEQCEISRVNMKADFKNMLKTCERYRNYYLDTVVK